MFYITYLTQNATADVFINAIFIHAGLSVSIKFL